MTEAGGAGGPATQSRQVAALAHLSALVMLVGVPSILGPLVVWILKRHDDPFVDTQGRRAIDFHLSVLIYGLVVALLLAVVIMGGLLPFASMFMGFLLLGGLWILAVVMSIVGGLRASNGEDWHYPFAIRLLSR